MDIPVENYNFLSSVILLGSSGSHSNIVKKTKASDDVAVSMMARRAHNGEGLVDHHLRTNIRDSFDCTAC